MNLHEAESRLLHTMDQFEGRLPVEQLEEMRELVRAGEAGIAFENLCTQAFEYDLSVPASLAATLKRLGSAMGISKNYWERLEVEQ